MRPGGLCLVVDLAVAAVHDPLVDRHAVALKLGALREDVVCLPLLGWVWESLSLSHSTGPRWPGGFMPLLSRSPQSQVRRRFERARSAQRSGRAAAAFVQLGRAAHVLIDMACPVHALRTMHLDDPFEWYVEGNASALARLPLAARPAANSLESLVTSLAQLSQQFAPDRTHHPLGRLLHRLGLRRALTRREVQAQAEILIPAATAHLVALIELFLRTVDSP